MTSKKKPKLLFEIPAEVESGAQSGWVYRSGTKVETSQDAVDTSIRATAATTMALAMATMAQAVVLGITIAAIPLTLGLRLLQSFAAHDEAR